jgi:hypothetical protein
MLGDDEKSVRVFECYGRTMLTVQVFEQALATVVVAFKVKEKPTKHSTKRQFERGLKRRLREYTHAFQKASASELRKMLPEGFDPQLTAEIEQLVDKRDALAHRYLNARLAHDRKPAEGVFKRGTLDQLIELAVDFAAITQKLTEVRTALAVSLPKDENRPDWLRDFYAELAPRVMFGKSGEEGLTGGFQ